MVTNNANVMTENGKVIAKIFTERKIEILDDTGCLKLYVELYKWHKAHQKN